MDKAKVDKLGFNEDIENIERHISIMAHSIGLKCMLLDALAWDYFFYSDSFILLTGYKREELPSNTDEAIRMLVASVSLEDKIEENRIRFQRIASLIQEKSLKSIVINSSFKLRTKMGMLVNVDCVCHPLYFNGDGLPWVYLCVIKPSRRAKVQKTTIYMYDGDKRQIYLPLKEKFVPYDNTVLKEEELTILHFATLGYNEQKMAKMLNQNITYIKYYKKRIFAKLNVENITEAVYVALQSGLLK